MFFFVLIDLINGYKNHKNIFPVILFYDADDDDDDDDHNNNNNNNIIIITIIIISLKPGNTGLLSSGA